MDTVLGGCYRREVFDRIGLFNEQLARGQDMEFNLRLKRAGLRTLLIPGIKSKYYARSSMISFLKHNFVNGAWAIIPFLYTREMPVRLRHLVPLLFVSGVIGLGVLGMFFVTALWALVAIMLAYALASVLSGLHVAVRERSPMLALAMPVVFAGLHFSYGSGSLWGLLKVFGNLIIRPFKSVRDEAAF